MSRAFSFSQDTPNKIKKTISSVFRSPFQGYSHSLHDQKASKLSSLASLQLTPTLLERRNNLQNKSTYQLTKSAKHINLNEPYESLSSIHSNVKHIHYSSYPNGTILDDMTTTNIDDDDDDGENRGEEKTAKLENDLMNGKLLKQIKMKQKNNIDAISYDSLINATKYKSKRPFEITNEVLVSSASNNTINLNGPSVLINNSAVLNRKNEASMTSLDSCASTIIGGN